MSAQAPMENNDDGWDLFAVVRSCRAGSRNPPPTPLPPPANTLAPKGATAGAMFSSCFPSLTPSGISQGVLEKLCKPFLSAAMQPNLTPRSCSSPPSSAPAPSPAPARRPLSQSTSRLKRGKNQQKRVVCQVPADGLAADMWAWRKYGQKPIKGSPFPRGYYRCSSSKGCLARKQVERSRTDIGMFVITYTGEHNHQIPTHRNSLAGSSRQKFPAAAAIGEQANLPEGSPNTPLKREEGSGEEEEEEEEDEEEEEGVLLVEDMEVVGEDEVLFMGGEVLQDSSEVSSSVNPEAIDAFFGNGSDLDGGFLIHPWSENSQER